MRFKVFLLSTGLLACGDDGRDGPVATPGDGGAGDAAPMDTGLLDAGLLDGGGVDAAAPLDAAARIFWRPCGDAGYQCATMPAASGPITLALTKRPADGTRLGSLVWNPGGPGISAIDFTPELVAQLSPEVLASYDVIAMDPRGVGHSDPIDCHSKLQQLYALDPTPDSEQEWADADAVAKAFADECANKYAPELLSQLTTLAGARDLDLLRERLGEDKLDFLGISYGSSLGTYFVANYPDKVGTVVLDGPIDLGQSTLELSLQQAKGFEQALANYFAWCDDTRCPWANGNPAQTFAALLAMVEQEPLPSSGTDRPCGPGELVNGVATFLYGGEEGWSVISEDLLLAVQGDGTNLVIDTDIYLGRDFDTGEYGNATESNYAINCIDDDPLTVEQLRAQADAFQAASPTFGGALLIDLLVCAHWPVKGARPPLPANVTSPPFLLLGTTQDPATPYAWAQTTAARLGPSARLFTYDGEGHGAYARGIPCVDAVVDSFLLRGELPGAGSSCATGSGLFRKGAALPATRRLRAR